MSQDKSDTTALEHLGDVLDMLVDLSPMDQCEALTDAVAYYNRMRPDLQVQRHAGYLTKLVHIGPMDADIVVRDASGGQSTELAAARRVVEAAREWRNIIYGAAVDVTKAKSELDDAITDYDEIVGHDAE